MRDVIQKVIATEAEGKRMLFDARAEAGRILTEAQTRAQQLMAHARKEVQLAAQKILTAAVADAEIDKQTRLASTTAGIEKQINLSDDERRQAVEAVVRCVCG